MSTNYHSDSGPSHCDIIKPSLTCSLVHRKLIGQDAANLAEGGHLDAVLLQLALHVVDFLLCEGWRNRRNKLAVSQVNCERVKWRLAAHL